MARDFAELPDLGATLNEEHLRRAVRVAAEGRPGPVLLSLPLDVQQRPVVPRAAVQGGPAAPARGSGRLYRPAADPQAAQEAAGLLAAAQRPVLIVGGGVSGDRARAAVAALAAAADAPVVTTWLRKSQFLDDDPHYVGALGYGAHRAAEDAVRTADVVLAVGCRFSEFTTRRWTLVPADATVIQVDVDAEQIGRVLPVAVGIQADAALAAEAIGQAIGRPPRALGRATRRRELRARYEEESVIPGGGPSTSPVPSGALVAELQARSTGTRRCWCRTCTRSGRGSRGTCGSASPTATSPPTAAAWAGACPPRWASRWPGRTGRSSPCSATAASGWSPRTWATIRERLPVVCVVVNNFSFGNTRDRQRLAHGGRYLGVFYDNPDFAAYARLLGAHGERVDKSGDLAGAIDRAVASGRPAVIDVVQDQQEGLPPGLAPPAAHPNPA